MTDPNPLNGKTILVTGGAGFIGSHVVDLLLAEGVAEVRVIDNMIRGRHENLAAAAGDPRLKVVEGDIRDRALMTRLIEGCDTVFHMAALRITHCVAEPDLAMEVMVQATYDILQDCRRAGVRKVVMSSSASIYGLARHFPTTEDEAPYPNRTFYGAAKSFAEGLLRSMNDVYGMDYVALRYFNVYGPRMDLHGKYTEVMVRWMERVARGLPPIIFGDGLQTLDMVHVRDVARANIHAAKAPATDAVFNVGSGTETTLLRIAEMLSQGMGRADLVPVHEAERAVNPVPKRQADVTAAARDLDFTTRIGLAEGLAELIAWWRMESSQPELEAAS